MAYVAFFNISRHILLFTYLSHFPLTVPFIFFILKAYRDFSLNVIMRYASMVYRDYISTTEIILDILQTMIKKCTLF